MDRRQQSPRSARLGIEGPHERQRDGLLEVDLLPVQVQGQNGGVDGVRAGIGAGPVDLVGVVADDHVVVLRNDRVVRSGGSGLTIDVELSPDQLEETVQAGFTFVALGSDGGLVAAGMRQLASAFDRFRGQGT